MNPSSGISWCYIRIFKTTNQKRKVITFDRSQISDPDSILAFWCISWAHYNSPEHPPPDCYCTTPQDQPLLLLPPSAQSDPSPSEEESSPSAGSWSHQYHCPFCPLPYPSHPHHLHHTGFSYFFPMGHGPCGMTNPHGS